MMTADERSKMKAIRLTVLSMLSVLFLITSAYGAGTRIGVIDFQKVLKDSKGGKAAKAEIEKKGKGLENLLKKKGAEIEERDGRGAAASSKGAQASRRGGKVAKNEAGLAKNEAGPGRLSTAAAK